MTTDPGKWGDLNVRVASGVAIGAIGLIEIILGGVWFEMLVVFVTAIMVWELAMMVAPDRHTPAMLLAVLSAAILSGALLSGLGWELLLFGLVPVFGALALPHKKLIFLIFALYLQLGGWGLIHFRADHGLLWLLWMLAVVIITDIAGYFAGRTFGGPKFWPAISPKKTWSGTCAGWVGAAMVGLAFAIFTKAGFSLILLSVAVSFASQMGDIVESALKRYVGAKDSSDLIPGHGGVFDRFDAVLGATVFMLFLTFVLGWAGPEF
jgi:phosphatidate cytidylyltransferase